MFFFVYVAQFAESINSNSLDNARIVIKSNKKKWNESEFYNYYKREEKETNQHTTNCVNVWRNESVCAFCQNSWCINQIKTTSNWNPINLKHLYLFYYVLRTYIDACACAFVCWALVCAVFRQFFLNAIFRLISIEFCTVIEKNRKWKEKKNKKKIKMLIYLFKNCKWLIMCPLLSKKNVQIIRPQSNHCNFLSVRIYQLVTFIALCDT